MKIATTTADFSGYINSVTDIRQVLEYLAECGFKHIDVSFSNAVYQGSPLCESEWKHWVDEIANTGAKLGIDFVQAHSSESVYSYGEERSYKTAMIRRQLEACQMLGIPGTVVHAITIKDGHRADFMKKNAEFYRELLETSEKTGVMVYTENTCTNNSPYYYLLSAEHFHELRREVGEHPLFGICWDVGHAHIQKVDQYHEILALGEHLKAVHIHDNEGTRDKHQSLYAGNCGYDAIMKGLIDVKFKGYFTLEAFAAPGPAKFMHRRPFEKDGVIYDKLCMLPLEFKMRAEKLMYDTAKYMLECYECFEE